MNKLLTTITLLCFSVVAKGQLEDTYLCIGEVSAVIYTTMSGNGQLRSNSGTNDNRWLVSKAGLKMFGNDYFNISPCVETSSRLFCGDEDLSTGFFSLIFSNNTYTALTYYKENIDDDEVQHFFTAGKCSKI